jgi:Cu-processing system permease protein
MRSVWIIAINTFREIIRDRILYGIVVFALLLFGLSLALGELSFIEQARISANFGFTGIQLGSAVLAIFVGSTLVAREIEKQTILTLLARPISRTQFLFGKFFGLVFVVIVVLSGLAIVLGALVSSLGLNVGLSFGVALLGVFLEALVLVSMTLFFGVFARPITTVIFASALFLIGHWVSSLGYFVEKSSSPLFKFLAGSLGQIVPDLERFNWRVAPVYQASIPPAEILSTAGYALGWVLVLLSLTVLIFRRRDFV